MEVSTMKQILKNTDPQFNEFARRFKVSKDYYETKTAITARDKGEAHANVSGKDAKDPNGIRNSDNRVPSNYHQLIVDQEASYLATTRPDIDVQNDSYNQTINDTLGADFALILNQLVIDAANAGTAWLHYWKDPEDNSFKFAPVNPAEVKAIYTTDLTPKIKAIRRSYEELDTDSGNTYTVHEYWDDTTVTVFKSDADSYSNLEEYTDRFILSDTSTGQDIAPTNTLEHGLGAIPFIEFDKNRYKRPELLKYKGYIDTYDMIYNGLVNDLQDIQQVIMILTNYGGEDLETFRKMLKEDKAVKVDSMGNGDNSGVDTLKIDIPTDAKQLALDLANKKIFKFGQGIDPDDFLVENNATGPALKMLYSHLELKASQTEQYFRRGIDLLIRAILLNVSGVKFDGSVNQTWHRASIRNDYEQAQIIQMLAPVTSKENIAKANPIVDDWKDELTKQKDEDVDDSFANDDEMKKLKEQLAKQNNGGD